MKRVSKHELRETLGYTNRTMFLRDVLILTSDKDCPFTYEDITRGNYVKGRWAQFIIESL